nr:TPA_asm: hypothetical protein HUJ06_014304 [Nelumbo nucifera]
MENILHRFRLLLLLLCCCMNSIAALDANTDREALLSFKSMVSDPRISLIGWNQSVPLCAWFGVSCTTTQKRVRSLLLVRLGLSGTIPHQLANLTSLEILDLSSNDFHGPIPQEFSSLARLQHLHLFNNSLAGSIPVALSRCSNLVSLTLPWNQLTGSIPSEFGRLSMLKILQLSKNNLTGTIPPTLGNLSSLTVLGLSQNELVGRIPNELGHLKNLVTLQISVNQLTGEIPHSIFNISSLEYISVTQNSLVGKLMVDMGVGLPNLRQLYMGMNKLEGPIPSSLSNASQIRVLDLSSNLFQGSFPLLGGLKNLVSLNLGYNNLTSTTELNIQIFESLANCIQLEEFIVPSNQLAGELPSSTANLSSHLQEFCVDRNFLSGGFPQGIEKFRNLTVLSLYKNSFKGALPSSIGQLHNLQRFSLYQNMFSGVIPDSFRNLTQLYQLFMANNQFSGTIPKSIGDCQSLQELGLDRNKLSGSIPKEIFRPSNLRILSLARNALTGSLPTEVDGLHQLMFLDISDNQLSGAIPATIDQCSNLQNVSMARNKFNGSIPRSIGKLAGLESLDLSSNNLSGPFPDELGNLRVLQKLNLSFNDLEGQVPRNDFFKNLSRVFLQGNSKLCIVEDEIAGKLGIHTCTSTTRRREKGSVAPKIIIPIVSIVTLGILFYSVKVLIDQKKRGKESNSLLSFKGQRPKISYSQILAATNDFAEENLIGKGGYGSVYKGIINGGIETGEDGSPTLIAVKVLDLKQSKAAQSFTTECEALRNVRHRNLVKVITSCSSIDHRGDEFKALVMEFMSNGSLDKWLHPEDTESGLSLNLTQRLNIAIDVASAMDYLHNDCDPPVVHCDLKPSNILLDDNMRAHVGDFGLARLLSKCPTQVQSNTIGVKGSIGYIAPEYGMGGKASKSGDVYSYGVLLLEMFTGKKPTDEMFKDGRCLSQFASAVYGNGISEIVDSRLFEDDNDSEHNGSTSNPSFDNITTIRSSSSSTNNSRRREECLEAVVKVGLSCTAVLAKDRLTMRETLTKLLQNKQTLLES